jgi:hypothetical protein
MRILFLTFLFIIFAFQAEAQEFSVSQIPDSLKENAYSVIRDYKMEVRMASPKEGEANFHITATILNKKGKSAADFVCLSDMFRN